MINDLFLISLCDFNNFLKNKCNNPCKVQRTELMIWNELAAKDNLHLPSFGSAISIFN